MSTILETATDVVATLAGHGPQHRYRQSVFDGNYDEGVCFDARRIRSEWEVDRQRYLSRVAASESLATEVPRLQAIAADVAKTLAEVESFARSPLPDSMTVAELRGKFTAAGAKIGDNTPAELSAVLQWYVDPSPTGHLGASKSRAIRSQSAIGDCRSRVRQILGQTAADSGPSWSEVGLSQQIAEVQRRIDARREVLASESKAALARTECEKLSRGEYPASYSSLVGQQQPPLANLYRAARRKLDALLDLVAGKPDAEKANEVDKQELQRLTAKMSEARAASLEKLADPKAMKWSA